jgi:hypothetical protein
MPKPFMGEDPGGRSSGVGDSLCRRRSKLTGSRQWRERRRATRTGATRGWETAAPKELSPSTRNVQIAGSEAAKPTVMPALAAVARPKRAAEEMIIDQKHIGSPAIV